MACTFLRLFQAAITLRRRFECAIQSSFESVESGEALETRDVEEGDDNGAEGSGEGCDAGEEDGNLETEEIDGTPTELLSRQQTLDSGGNFDSDVELSEPQIDDTELGLIASDVTMTFSITADAEPASAAGKLKENGFSRAEATTFRENGETSNFRHEKENVPVPVIKENVKALSRVIPTVQISEVSSSDKSDSDSDSRASIKTVRPRYAEAVSPSSGCKPPKLIRSDALETTAEAGSHNLQWILLVKGSGTSQMIQRQTRTTHDSFETSTDKESITKSEDDRIEDFVKEEEEDEDEELEDEELADSQEGEWENEEDSETEKEEEEDGEEDDELLAYSKWLLKGRESLPSRDYSLNENDDDDDDNEVSDSELVLTQETSGSDESQQQVDDLIDDDDNEDEGQEEDAQEKEEEEEEEVSEEDDDDDTVDDGFVSLDLEEYDSDINLEEEEEELERERTEEEEQDEEELETSVEAFLGEEDDEFQRGQLRRDYGDHKKLSRQYSPAIYLCDPLPGIPESKASDGSGVPSRHLPTPIYRSGRGSSSGSGSSKRSPRSPPVQRQRCVLEAEAPAAAAATVPDDSGVGGDRSPRPPLSPRLSSQSVSQHQDHTVLEVEPIRVTTSTPSPEVPLVVVATPQGGTRTHTLQRSQGRSPRSSFYGLGSSPAGESLSGGGSSSSSSSREPGVSSRTHTYHKYASASFESTRPYHESARASFESSRYSFDSDYNRHVGSIACFSQTSGRRPSHDTSAKSRDFIRRFVSSTTTSVMDSRVCERAGDWSEDSSSREGANERGLERGATGPGTSSGGPQPRLATVVAASGRTLGCRRTRSERYPETRGLARASPVRSESLRVRPRAPLHDDIEMTELSSPRKLVPFGECRGGASKETLISLCPESRYTAWRAGGPRRQSSLESTELEDLMESRRQTEQRRLLLRHDSVTPSDEDEEPRSKVRYNDMGSLEQPAAPFFGVEVDGPLTTPFVLQVNEEMADLLEEAGAVRGDETHEHERIKVQCRALWKLRATLEEEDPEPEIDPMRMEVLSSPDHISPEGGNATTSHTTSFESNTETVPPDTGGRSEVVAETESVGGVSSSSPLKNIATPEARRTSYRAILASRLKVLDASSRPPLSSENSFDSADTECSSATDMSRPEVLTTSFESTTDCPTDSTSDTHSHRLQQMKADSGYKSLETNGGRPPKLSKKQIPLTTDESLEVPTTDCEIVRDRSRERDQEGVHEDVLICGDRDKKSGIITQPIDPQSKRERLRKSVQRSSSTSKALAKKRREYLRERHITDSFFDSVQELEGSDAGSVGSDELSGKRSVFARFLHTHRYPASYYRLPQRDYSIDEQSDRLFKEFSRQEPLDWETGSFGSRRGPRLYPGRRLHRHMDTDGSPRSHRRKLSPQDSIEEEEQLPADSHLTSITDALWEEDFSLEGGSRTGSIADSIAGSVGGQSEDLRSLTVAEDGE
ncbi:mucin related 89F isoform X2 [Oratosquilla oratoria]|uniref:mucin related 89F isoform X2 n=1 Tax=Oratosquilla oratoria TaxID=337810 RepID=UPI003F776772